MSLVVSGSHRSVHAAYQASEANIGVSIASIYKKLNGIELNTSAQLVRYAVEQVESIIYKLRDAEPSLWPGKRVKLFDGNCIGKTQHRL
jgi:hypothetical protein